MMKSKIFTIFFLYCINIVLSQSYYIEGGIFVEDTNKPITNANILIKSTEFGTTSNDNGHFSIIWNESYPVHLVITHIGYQKKEIILTEPGRTDIYLTPRVIQIDKIIIEGVLRHSEREVSSKIEVVDLKEIETRGIRDVSEILTELEGINIYTTSYGKQTISIRGSNSNEIAVYLDGIKLNNSATGSADLAYVDLTDLDNIEVIKGSSSILFGPGNFGGVVLMHSKTPEYNSIEINQGFGITDNNDQDLSGAVSIQYRPIGLYGRYSGKSRLFDGRTLFTSIFGNYGGLASFTNQEIAVRHVNHNKFIKYPSGGIVSSDELYVNRFTFYGNILNSTGWDIQIGQKEWSWDDSFFSNLTREFKDNTTQYRVNKGFKFNNFSGSIQFEKEIQDYISEQLVQSSYGLKSWRSVGELSQTDKGIASVIRYDVIDPVANISLLRWEGGIRYSETSYSQYQISQEYDDLIPGEFKEYEFDDKIDLSTYRLGVYAEGKFNNNTLQFFFNQGFNNRLPTLNDRFLWADGKEQLGDYYRNLLSFQSYLGSSEELREKINRTRRIMSKIEDGLDKETVNSTEVNSQFSFNNINNDLIDHIILGGGIFRNYFFNKIAYLSLDNNLVLPFSTSNAWLNGAEINFAINGTNGLFKLSGNLTWVKPNAEMVFSNKPSTTGSIIFNFRKNWLGLNISHIFNGPQNYLHGGVSIEQLQKQKNTNLTISINKRLWHFDTTLSYTIRNVFSDDVTILTAGTQTGDVFNYYDAHRKLFNIKISLSDRNSK
ncbi:MAG: TonB-dependent receptor [Candidatus Neomarinimicrobiota bacterium]